MDLKEIYEEKIYEYCKNNIGEKVLDTAFTNLWPFNLKEEQEEEISPKDLAILTSQIILDLSGEGILKKAEKPKELEFTPHAMYEIFPNKN